MPPQPKPQPQQQAQKPQAQAQGQAQAQAQQGAQKPARTIEGFDPRAFAKNLAIEASQVIPPDLKDADKKFVIDIVHKFCLLCGDALVKDEKYNLLAPQASIITQFIG